MPLKHEVRKNNVFYHIFFNVSDMFFHSERELF